MGTQFWYFSAWVNLDSCDSCHVTDNTVVNCQQRCFCQTWIRKAVYIPEVSQYYQKFPEISRSKFDSNNWYLWRHSNFVWMSVYLLDVKWKTGVSDMYYWCGKKLSDWSSETFGPRTFYRNKPALSVSQ